MNETKELQNKPEHAPARDEHGRLLPGHTANPGGRPKDIGAFREKCRKHTQQAINTLVRAMRGPDGAMAAKVLLEFAWGRAPAELKVGGTETPLRLGWSVEELRDFYLMLKAAKEKQP